MEGWRNSLELLRYDCARWNRVEGLMIAVPCVLFCAGWLFLHPCNWCESSMYWLRSMSFCSLEARGSASRREGTRGRRREPTSPLSSSTSACLRDGKAMKCKELLTAAAGAGPVRGLLSWRTSLVASAAPDVERRGTTRRITLQSGRRSIASYKTARNPWANAAM